MLPPGEWDPTIRIEPPNQIPSQEKRKQVGPAYAVKTLRIDFKLIFSDWTRIVA